MTHHEAVTNCRSHPLHWYRVAQLIPPHCQSQQSEVAGGGALAEVEGVVLVGDINIRELGLAVLYGAAYKVTKL